MAVHVLGIRHHGPGSARHVRHALEELRPDIILIEGPPEGEELVRWATHAEMSPPVALLVYRPEAPQQAVFYPFAVFSPEWQAIQYGLEHKLPIRFIDMPLSHKFALQEEAAKAEAEDAPLVEEIHHNPLQYLAQIAGYEDAEVWWEQQVELSQSSVETFQAIAEGMQALRENYPEPKNQVEEIREAFLRRGIRTAQKEMFAQIAVVCGAWHAPALQSMPTQKADDDLLRKLPKTKVESTWIPWTYSRLSFASGYGAGINSPGWYQHLWLHPEDDGTQWLVHVARVFRQNQLDISSAHVIETLRLAHSLAALRGQPKASLVEFNEAVRTVMCIGDDIQLQLIWRELIVGHQIGSIPAESPQVPLQRDMEAWQKKLRLKPQEQAKIQSLDLREETGLQRSILLHRLLVLEIPWGEKRQVSGKGTFKEEWELLWKPELHILLLEKAAWGNTLEEAANAYLAHLASQAQQLPQITQLLEDAIPAELTAGVEALMKRLDELAAKTSDVQELMQAFLPLVQVKRYGNVRNTEADTIQLILDSLMARIYAGLPPACTNLNEETGELLAGLILQLDQAVQLLEEEAYHAEWYEALEQVLHAHQANALICGTCCKLLHSAGIYDATATALTFSSALSRGNDPSYASIWIEGFLKNSATTLLLDDRIWSIIDDWLADLSPETFQELVPILRRTFSDYTGAEKRKLASKAKSGGSVALVSTEEAALDEDRARRLLPVFYNLLGLPHA
ncbi:hypothetical protein EFA69_19450 [Rufibacter immobilis]|uniref:Uncharacterized protein n=1 Tax=Rufibacter immobilis TaxID=1348778 RepID=A0A3M9MTL7_9BACT|nr:DUF5682 family protein [Rufibacter immobilis]RNI28243.1 hypothetical protein EFA69_19450 [Rufibacter immobilis]